MNWLRGKVVLLTGASRGIGAALADVLERRGAVLALTARTRGSRELIAEGDLRSEEFRVRLVEKTVERHGRIDCLINNAGRGSYFRVSDAPMDDTRDLFELNLFAPLHLAQLATPWLKKTGGSLVNVISIAGQISLPWLPVYSAGKFALASLTISQRADLKPAGVHVMAVFPGYVSTEFQSHAAGTRPPDKVVKGKRFAISAPECANAIVEGLDKKRNQVVTPWSGWPLVLANRLFPSAVEARVAGI